MSSLKIITTKDGSHSLLNEALNETYHSVHGAVQESVHVFIKNGLDFFLEQSAAPALSVLEIGFGTGLNALLTVQRALTISQQIQYTSLEAFPVTEEVWSQLNYTEAVGLKEYFEKLHRAEWNVACSVLPNFELYKSTATLQQAVLPPSSFDLVYFDAFAPSKQPEMWALTALEKVVKSMKTGGVLVTYCAQGQFKRDLASLGLKITPLPGPPGKKEMVRGQKQPKV